RRWLTRRGSRRPPGAGALQLTGRPRYPAPDPHPGRPARLDTHLTSATVRHSKRWRGTSMKRNVIIATAALGALVVAGCSSGGSSSSSSSGTATKSCVATIGMEGPLTGPVAVLGQEQLHFAQLALLKDNLANHTKITLAQGDTQLNPAQATT